MFYFLENEILLNGKWIHHKHPKILDHLMNHAMNQSNYQSHKIFLQISKCLTYNAEKTLTVEDNKKRMNIANI